METDFQLLLRLVTAGVLCGALGWEREAAGKSAGFRTHMLVGIASTMFVVVAKLLILEFHGMDDNLSFDPLRTVQAVATGIGFLGGGIIWVSKDEEYVHGLTTAASVWAASALGMLAGLGRYPLAIGATLLLLFILRVLVRFDTSKD